MTTARAGSESSRGAAERRHLEEQFGDLATQDHAAKLGLWIFLASEVLFFAAPLALYAAYRSAHREAFAAAAGRTDLALGTAMTYLLLGASLLVALAVHATRTDRSRLAHRLLGGATVLALVFLGFELYEYDRLLAEGLAPGRFYAGDDPRAGARAFWTLYYATTGLHLLHVAIGAVVLGWLSRRARRGDFGRHYTAPLEVGGMYWHFVDVVWLFLWPLFYLLR